jgi:hypothetical protein
LNQSSLRNDFTARILPGEIVGVSCFAVGARPALFSHHG